MTLLILTLAGCGGNGGSASSPKKGNSGTSLEDQIARTSAYVQEEVKEVDPSDAAGDWVVLSLVSSGADVPEKYFASYYDTVRALAKSRKGVLDENSYTTTERTSMALHAIGRDPRDVEGYDLMKPVDEYEGVRDQGVNAEIFALISANYVGYKLKNEERYREDILASQTKDGSFSLDGENGDVDMTAMGIQALSYYSSDEKVSAAIDRGLAYLKEELGEDGSYGSCESTAQVIIALGMLHQDPLTAEGFQTGDRNLYDGLSAYAKDGAFEHTSGDGENLLATVQALCALDALKLAEEGKGLYE